MFGNRPLQTGEAQVSYPLGNNRASASSGYTYDASGNVTQDPSNQYGYDGEGRLCTIYNKTLASYTGYAYDGLGNRVAKGSGPNTLSCDNNLTVLSSFVLGPNGEQLDELSATGAVYSNVYANGKLLATYQFPTSNWTYALNDWLGTKRVVANATGAQAEYCLGQPFGDGLSCSGTSDPSPQHFTGKERDAESGLDYFGARYYASNMGRWMSPDWSAKASPVPYARLSDPQSLNLYSYVTNNPLSNIDRDGHDITVNGDAQKRYIADVQKASGLTLAADKNGKLSITASPDKLSAVGKQISNIIGDAKNHVQINALNNAPGVVGGAFRGNGVQTLNYSSIDAISGKGGFTAASIITHETTEAYAGLFNGSNFAASHAIALGYENAERIDEGASPRIGESGVRNGFTTSITVNFSFTKETIDYDGRSGSVSNVTVQRTNQQDPKDIIK